MSIEDKAKMVLFRKMKPQDIPAGLSLCRAAGWNQLARDWEILLQQSPNDCRVATRDGKVVGSVTTIRYQDAFSWIGMVLVHPSCQRQGIGIQLLKEALEILQNEETVKLDATPAGKEVYLKLNFVDEYRLSRMSIIASSDKLTGSLALSLPADKISALLEFDREVFGADRQSLLEWMWKGAPQLAFYIEENNKIQGYCLGRPGYSFTQIGPVVAKNAEQAKDLISAALLNCIGQPVVVDALHHNPEWKSWLMDIGFSELRPLIRMYKGSNTFTGLPEKQFAILGPEFG